MKLCSTFDHTWIVQCSGLCCGAAPFGTYLMSLQFELSDLRLLIGNVLKVNLLVVIAGKEQLK